MGKIGPSSVPKDVDYEGHTGKVAAEEAVIETYRQDEYGRVIQRIQWDDGSPDELRFCYYHKAKGTSDDAWDFIPFPADMRPETLDQLLRQAKSNPGFGNLLKKIDVR